VTMGPKSVMHAKEVILFANGKKKAAIIKKALQGPVTEDIPSSIFQLHPNFTVVLDEEAASELNM
ncbi:6-phosphogluconolactonase, partial [Listeria monocytogenes]|nr:6-phosphogluconolactonase [Listeria monocytogenes]NVS33114.1 6-phosphogluconolactonase [Listeria monocytogenes]